MSFDFIVGNRGQLKVAGLDLANDICNTLLYKSEHTQDVTLDSPVFNCIRTDAPGYLWFLQKWNNCKNKPDFYFNNAETRYFCYVVPFNLEVVRKFQYPAFSAGKIDTLVVLHGLLVWTQGPYRQVNLGVSTQISMSRVFNKIKQVNGKTSRISWHYLREHRNTVIFAMQPIHFFKKWNCFLMKRRHQLCWPSLLACS